MNKQDRSRIMAEAVVDYPAGTKFISPNDGKIYEVKSETKFYWNPDHANCLTSSDKGCIYLKGKWAKKIES